MYNILYSKTPYVRPPLKSSKFGHPMLDHPKNQASMVILVSYHLKNQANMAIIMSDHLKIKEAWSSSRHSSLKIRQMLSLCQTTLKIKQTGA